MRTRTASLVVLTGLAAIATADSLPFESIPFQCATICGPVVELTSLCDVHQSTHVLKRRRATIPRAVVDEGDSYDVDVQKRSFSVIVAAPTSFPPNLIAPPASEPPASPSTTTSSSTRSTTTTTSSSIESVPTLALPSAPSAVPEDNEDDEDADDGLVLPSRTNGLTNGLSPTLSSSPAVGTSADLQKGVDHGDAHAAADDAEEQCVCLNRSFDVARVAALCASCIMQGGDVENNVNVIVSACGFPTDEQYDINKDSVVNNVRVVATRPAQYMGEGAGVDHSSSAARTLSLGLGCAVGLVSMMATLWL